MAKKGLLVLVLVAVIAGGAFAEWYNSYAPGIDNSKVLINAGIGFGFSGTYSMGIPPLSLSADFRLPIKVPITLGGIVGFSTWGWESGSGAWLVDVTYTNIAFGLRGAYHFNFVKNLDVYAGLTLGWVVQTASVEYGSAYNVAGAVKPSHDGVSFFLYGFNIGGRYFFTNNIGVYLELGYSGLQIASIGLSLKF
jgi:hypothetical protein